MIRPLATVDEPGLESQAPHAAPDLASLQAEFPRYRIWREGICGRVRYVARSLEHGLRPHTVVTGDLAEMQAALEPSQYAALIPFRPEAPNVARMYDFLLGGKDHLAAMAPGSYLVISAGTCTGTDPALIRSLQSAYSPAAPVTGRTQADITAWFTGLTLVPPGLTDVRHWQRDSPRPPYRLPRSHGRFLAGVAVKPANVQENRP
jgi:S-adenosyl methyltransferase